MSIYQWKKICVDIIGPHFWCREEVPKLIIKCGAMTNPGVGLLQITNKCNNETMMVITSLEIVRLTRYPGRIKFAHVQIYTSKF